MVVYKPNFFCCAFLVASFSIVLPTSVQAEQVIAQRNPQTQTNPKNEFKQLLEQGKKLVESGDYPKALEIYIKAARMQPKNGSAYSGVGILYVKQKNYSAALLAFRRAIELEPNNADYHHALGYLHGSLGNYQAARDSYQEAIRLNKKHVDAYLGLASVLTHLGDRKGAGQAYQQAEKIAPKSPRVAEFRSLIITQ